MLIKERLLQETIVLLSADLYQLIDEHCECYSDTADKIISLAKEFEMELDWKQNDERDYIKELEKFEKRVVKEYERL